MSMNLLKSELKYMVRISMFSSIFFVIVTIMIGFTPLITNMLSESNKDFLGLIGIIFLLISLLLSFGEINYLGARKILAKPHGYLNFSLKWSYFIGLRITIFIIEDLNHFLVPIISFIIGVIVLISYILMHKKMKRLTDFHIKEAFLSYYNNDDILLVEKAYKDNHQLNHIVWIIIVFITIPLYRNLSDNIGFLVFLGVVLFFVTTQTFIKLIKWQKDRLYGDSSIVGMIAIYRDFYTDRDGSLGKIREPVRVTNINMKRSSHP
jgi:hypothetical protein